jgi:hypothetical protein
MILILYLLVVSFHYLAQMDTCFSVFVFGRRHSAPHFPSMLGA